MDPASPCVALASCHSPGIRLLKIIQRQQREGDEYPSLHGFAAHCFLILAHKAGWADVATLSSQGTLGAEESAFPQPLPQLGLEKLHQGARPSFVSSLLLSWQWETAHRHGADPATDCPDGLGHIPASSLQARGPLCSCWLAGSPEFAALAASAWFPLGLFWVLFGFSSRLGKQAGVGGQ